MLHFFNFYQLDLCTPVLVGLLQTLNYNKYVHLLGKRTCDSTSNEISKQKTIFAKSFIQVKLSKLQESLVLALASAHKKNIYSTGGFRLKS